MRELSNIDPIGLCNKCLQLYVFNGNDNKLPFAPCDCGGNIYPMKVTELQDYLDKKDKKRSGKFNYE